MNRGFVIVIFCFLCVSVSAQELIPYRVANQWGFINFKGTMKIAPQYDSVVPFKYHRFFKKNLSSVFRNGMETKIDEKGTSIKPFANKKVKKFDEESYLIALEKVEGKYELYNSIEDKFYNEELDAYKFIGASGLIMIEKNGKVGLIDEAFNKVTEINYDQIRIKRFTGSSEKVTPFDEKVFKEIGVYYSREGGGFYINQKRLRYDEMFVIMTLISEKETTNKLYTPKDFYEEILRKEYPEDSSSIEVEVEYADFQNEKDTNPKFSTFRFQDCYSTSEHCAYSIGEYGRTQYGVYNFKMDKSSKLYSKVRRTYGDIDYIVTEDGVQGAMSGDLELIIPVKYKEITSVHGEVPILHLKIKSGYGSEKSLYDYYNLETKKTLIKNVQYHYGMNYDYEIKTPKLYRFFLVLKEDVYFYMGEDGRIFYKK